MLEGGKKGKYSFSFLARLLISVALSLIFLILIVFSLFKGVFHSYFFEIENVVLKKRAKNFVYDLKVLTELYYYKISSRLKKVSSKDFDFMVFLDPYQNIKKTQGNILKGFSLDASILRKKFGLTYIGSHLYKFASIKFLNNTKAVFFKEVDLKKIDSMDEVEIWFSKRLPKFLKRENVVVHKDEGIYYSFSLKSLGVNLYVTLKEKDFLYSTINKIFLTQLFFFILTFLGCVCIILCFNSRILIRNIKSISEKLKRISDLEDLTKRLGYIGIKEIDDLCENINSFLDKLERSYTSFKSAMDVYYKLVTDSLEVMFIFDFETKRIVHYNEAFKSLFLYRDEEIKNLTIYDLPADDMADKNLERVSRGEHYLGERPYKRKDGTIVYVEVISYVMNVQGKKLISVLLRDITKQKMEREYIAYMAYHDPLTGLFNRAYVLKVLTDMLALYSDKKKDTSKKIAVIMCDLNKFKQINDTYGHLVGDKVLKEVAKRLKNSFRETDVVARLGGDEFLIILPDIMEDKILVVLEKIPSFIKKPIFINKKFLSVGISMGVCVCPDDGVNAEDVLKRADKAMYYAKKNKKDWVFYKEL